MPAPSLKQLAEQAETMPQEEREHLMLRLSFHREFLEMLLALEKLADAVETRCPEHEGYLTLCAAGGPCRHRQGNGRAAMTLAQELQALADQIKARRPVPTPILRTEPVPEVRRTAYAKCCLCGDACCGFICERCDEGYRQLGL